MGKISFFVTDYAHEVPIEDDELLFFVGKYVAAYHGDVSHINTEDVLKLFSVYLMRHIQEVVAQKIFDDKIEYERKKVVEDLNKTNWSKKSDVAAIERPDLVAVPDVPDIDLQDKNWQSNGSKSDGVQDNDLENGDLQLKLSE